MAGDPPTGQPPGPDGPNLTHHDSNRARTKENDSIKKLAHCAAQEHIARGVLLLANGLIDISYHGTTPRPPQDPHEPLISSHDPLSSPSTEAMQETFKTVNDDMM
ncbi:ankyrin repeat-containing protein-like [Dorcoceras hygrometricum]|uniref:Ankyrin repeat-containing protein-like n=1 Tax=Dorcoceras hygrometricum TaxID=472368 RepID=A0A2Z7AZ15_9LAMI|nr:ankyrin repeat-containing protein-like [Dorcoceras hygrometricum]KZV32549.1 ankyrin repeat-containing protein-like [Dorcoceras hygrometricum]